MGHKKLLNQFIKILRQVFWRAMSTVCVDIFRMPLSPLVIDLYSFIWKIVYIRLIMHRYLNNWAILMKLVSNDRKVYNLSADIYFYTSIFKQKGSMVKFVKSDLRVHWILKFHWEITKTLAHQAAWTCHRGGPGKRNQ